ncbi:MAG: hypothetical protein WCG06_00405 [Candidatus Omnitrophota bacterium]
MKRLFCAGTLAVLALSGWGCASRPTYPAAQVPKAIEDICKKEYSVDVTARVVGKTVGAVVVVDDLVGGDKQIRQEAQERIFHVLGVVCRVVLSSDLPVDFCTVIVREETQHIEFAMTRYLDDLKRAEAYMQSVEETIQRMVVSQERSYGPGQEDRFVLADIQLPDFLAQQIAQRIRYAVGRSSKKQTESPMMVTEGVYEQEGRIRRFKFSILSFKPEGARQTMLESLRTVAAVLSGYGFKDYDEFDIRDFMNRQKLLVDRATLEAMLAKKITEDQILKKGLTEYRSIQDTFKMINKNSVTQDILADEAPLPGES